MNNKKHSSIIVIFLLSAPNIYMTITTKVRSCINNLAAKLKQQKGGKQKCTKLSQKCIIREIKYKKTTYTTQSQELKSQLIWQHRNPWLKALWTHNLQFSNCKLRPLLNQKACKTIDQKISSKFRNNNKQNMAK